MAYAETVDFDEAQTAVSTAIQLATNANLTDFESWRQRLELYKKHQPWRESFPFPNPPPKEAPKN